MAQCHYPGNSSCMKDAVSTKASQLKAANEKLRLCNRAASGEVSRPVPGTGGAASTAAGNDAFYSTEPSEFFSQECPVCQNCEAQSQVPEDEDPAYNRDKVNADWSQRWAPAWNKWVFDKHHYLYTERQWFTKRGLRVGWYFDVIISPDPKNKDKLKVTVKLNQSKSRIPRSRNKEENSKITEKFHEYAGLFQQQLEWSANPPPSFPPHTKLPQATITIRSDNYTDEEVGILKMPEEPDIKETTKGKIQRPCP